MATENVTIGFVLINYNSSLYTLQCVSSILKYTDTSISYRIVIVDNCSQNDDFEKLVDGLTENCQVLIFRSKVNLGFSAGNMLGVQLLNARYWLFINNDCTLLNDLPGILLTFMENHPSAAICTGQMYNSDGSLHHSFNYFPSVSLRVLGPAILRFFWPKQFPCRRSVFSEPVEVPYITGAAMFIRASAFEEIGGFDTNYFLYCEEEDICLRLNRSGYKVFVVPEAKFIHHMGKSTKRNYSIEHESCLSRLYFYRKHYNIVDYYLLRFFLFIKYFKKSIWKPGYLLLAWSVLRGIPLHKSLRTNQKMCSY